MKKSILLIVIIMCTFVISMISSANDIIETKSGLKYEELEIGSGNKAAPQKIATIHITVWKNDNGSKGEKLYTTSQGDTSTISFKVGTRKVADGLNQGVIGMREGGKRRLYVPPELNPQKASGEFPGKASLIYEVELIKIK